MRLAFFLALGSLAHAGCVTAPDVVPASGQRASSASAAGATVTAFDAPWRGDPYDLGRYITPVALEFRNDGPQPVRVAFVDLILTDESGRRYPTLDPYRGAPRASLLDGTLPLLASRGGGHVVAAPPAARGGGGFSVGAPPPGMGTPRRFGFGTSVPPAWSPGRRPGGLVGGGGYYGFSVYPWRPLYGDPLWDPYNAWVLGWSTAWYPSPSPPADLLTLGLPEGTLQPGGRVAGYVFFQRATDAPHRLLLTWDVRDTDGRVLGRAQIPLAVDD